MRINTGLAIATAVLSVAAVVTLFWPTWMDFTLPVMFGLSALALNWARMIRAGSRMRLLKTAMLLSGIVLALVPAEVIWCSAIRPENCGVESLSALIVYLGVPALVVLIAVTAIIDSLMGSARP